MLAIAIVASLVSVYAILRLTYSHDERSRVNAALDHIHRESP